MFRPRLRQAPLLATCLVLSASAAVAQVSPSAPVPAPATVASPAPAVSVPPATTEAPAPRQDPQPPPRSEISVAAAPLQNLDLFSAGGRNTQLGVGLWKGTSPDLAHLAIGALGDHPLEPALGQMARDLLATAATAPDGAGGDADLAGERVLALIRLGDLAAARMILSRTPGVAAHARLSQAAAELALWSGDLPRACGVSDALAEGRDGLFWLQLRSLCLTVAGKSGEAQLALELAAPASPPGSATTHLIGAVVGGGPGAQVASAETALAFAASRQLKLDPTAMVSTAPIPALIALAGDETLSPDLRRRAAWRLLTLGADAAETIRQALLLPVPAPPPPPPPHPVKRKGGRKSAPATQAPAPDEATTVARLYGLARTTADPAERARSLLTLLRTVHSVPLRAIGVVAAEDLGQTVPDGLAPDDRLLLATATGALDTSNSQAFRDSFTADASGAGSTDLAVLDAIRAMAGGNHPPQPVLDRLIELGAKPAGVDRSRVQAAAIILCGAMDAGTASGVSATARAQLSGFATGPAMHTATALLALSAADRKAPGETALLTLLAAQAEPLSPSDRALLLRALSRAGLEREARSIALDGLLALTRR